MRKKITSKKGVIKAIYCQQKVSSKARGHHAPEYTKSDLIDWLYSYPIFHELYAAWVDSGYISLLKPSVDRINDDLGYSFGNIQLMTWGENLEKGRQAAYRKTRVSVLQFSRFTDELLGSYESMSDAGRETGVCPSTISACAAGRRKSAGGFVWKSVN